MLNEANGTLELQRNELANRLGCVPSQISYVISSRFTPERGYVIESRRGGGGCIRIVRKQIGRNDDVCRRGDDQPHGGDGQLAEDDHKHGAEKEDAEEFWRTAD